MIDWCCIPAFDAPSVFGALLDTEKGGFFSIALQDTPEMTVKQYYLPETNILITRFFTHEGVGEITDFMPIQSAKEHTRHHRIIRAVRIVRGTMTFELTCRPAFNYARDTHTVQLSQRGVVFRSTDLRLGLYSSVPLEEDSHDGVHATFTLQKDQWAYFLLESTDDQVSELPHLTHARYQKILLDTKNYWRTWLSQCRYQGRWREMVQRSAQTLKLLTYAPTGAHSRPVRIGNGAYTQLQLDITGEFLDGIYVYMRKRGIYYGGWVYGQRLLNWLDTHWQTLDEGIWEVRGGKRGGWSFR